jgi:hypothetical protein
MSLTQSYIAANRFAYGANKATIKAIGQNQQEWLLAQLQSSLVAQTLCSSGDGQYTVVLVSAEFARTVAVNGTGGTDQKDYCFKLP